MEIQDNYGGRYSRKRLRYAVCSAAVAVTVCITGCTAREAATSGSRTPQAQQLGSVVAASAGQWPDQERLEKLWQQRTSDDVGSDYTLGPGDVLELSVPLEELEHREIRVSPLDTITMPLVGVVDVRGMTEQNLTDDLRQRLSKYMYDPPVSLFVKHYGSREVSVMGAVAKPGLYTLQSGSDTLMGMISKAGGMTPAAAAKVIFVPAGGGVAASYGWGNVTGVAQNTGIGESVDFTNHESATDHNDKFNGGSAGGNVQSVKIPSNGANTSEETNLRGESAPTKSALGKLQPIIIAVNDPTMRDYLELPARPGDTIIIPAAGEVTVGGWVRNPGGFPITPGMTALSAISAAGGALFSSSAQVLRTANDGERATTRINISHIQKGEEADVPVQSGDVVMVDKSALGAVPYAAYTVLSKFGTGMYIPVP